MVLIKVVAADWVMRNALLKEKAGKNQIHPGVKASIKNHLSEVSDHQEMASLTVKKVIPVTGKNRAVIREVIKKALADHERMMASKRGLSAKVGGMAKVNLETERANVARRATAKTTRNNGHSAVAALAKAGQVVTGETEVLVDTSKTTTDRKEDNEIRKGEAANATKTVMATGATASLPVTSDIKMDPRADVVSWNRKCLNPKPLATRACV